MRLFLLCLILCLFSLPHLVASTDEGFEAVDGPNVRVIDNPVNDTKVVYSRIPGQRQMIKLTYQVSSGKLVSRTVYVRDVYEKLRSCKIFDGKGKELIKVAYGYDKLGNLVRENMYSVHTGELVRVFVHYYFPGSDKKSKSVCFQKSQGFTKDEEKMINAPTAPDKDPFAKDAEKAPRGTPVKK